MNAKTTVTELLSLADIKINGSRPWDIKVNNENFFSRILQEFSLGLGESYMDEWWECDSLDMMISKLFINDIEGKTKLNPRLIWQITKYRLFNMQTKYKSKKDVSFHYDIGNDLYKKC